jgi:hypothetical protein
MKAERDAIDPIHVSDVCWFYSEGAGLAIVLEGRDSKGKHIRTLQARVPWAQIEQALAERPRKAK